MTIDIPRELHVLHDKYPQYHFYAKKIEDVQHLSPEQASEEEKEVSEEIGKVKEQPQDKKEDWIDGAIIQYMKTLNIEMDGIDMRAFRKAILDNLPTVFKNLEYCHRCKDYVPPQPPKSEECKVEEKRCEQEQVAPKKIEIEEMTLQEMIRRKLYPHSK